MTGLWFLWWPGNLMDKAFPSQGLYVSSSLTPVTPDYQSPDGSANFLRGELSTQPKAMRSARALYAFRSVDSIGESTTLFHEGAPQATTCHKMLLAAELTRNFTVARPSA